MKQDKKAAREALKEAGLQQQPTSNNQPPSSPGSLSTQISNLLSQPVQSPTLNRKKIAAKKASASRIDGTQMFDTNIKFKTTALQPVQSEEVELSSDDEESDDEIHHFMVCIVTF